jgi:hypothetical protein
MSTKSILCVHGVGHFEETDPTVRQAWMKAIMDSVRPWDPTLELTFDFLYYDDVFDKAHLDPATVLEAAGRLLGSCAWYGIGDLFRKKRGLDIPDMVRWTAGMVAQWSAEEDLRAKTRQRVVDKLNEKGFDVICAHSLGSLICYDTFIQFPKIIAGKRFLSIGSQIGNPCVRSAFAGRIVPLNEEAQWDHLYNPLDRVFTSEVRVSADNFVQVLTEFDKPNDPLDMNHDPVWYLKHPNARDTVWREVAGPKAIRPVRNISRNVRKTFTDLSERPDRRALLIGINQYPDPKDRLDGCVNDVFLMSSVLQDCGYDAQDIRVVLDDRATAQGIMDRLHWLLEDVKPGQERILFYSGHGAQIPTYNVRDEYDRLDECLVPYDFDWSRTRAITDNQFFDLYSQLDYDARFLAIFDCCHAGGMAREGGRKVRGLTPPDDIRHRALKWNTRLQMWEERDVTLPDDTLSGLDKKYVGEDCNTMRLGRAVGLRALNNRKYDQVRKKLGHKGPYLPVILEACKEKELASEYRHGVTSYGAFTYSLAEELRNQRQRTSRHPSFKELIKGVTDRLEDLHYDQHPVAIGPRDILKRPIPWKVRAARKDGQRRSA